MSSYYAWSDIKSGPKDEEESNVKTVKAGEKVSASDLGVSDEEFEALVESGAVREEEYPELPEGYTGSPAEYQREVEAMEAQKAEAEAFLSQDEAEQAEADAVAKDVAKAEKAEAKSSSTSTTDK